MAARHISAYSLREQKRTGQSKKGRARGSISFGFLLALFSPAVGEAQVPNAAPAQRAMTLKVTWVGVPPVRATIEDGLSLRRLQPISQGFKGEVYFGRSSKIPDSVYIDYGRFGMFRLPIRAPSAPRAEIPLHIDVETLYDFCNPSRVATISASSSAPLIAMRRLVQGRLLAARDKANAGCEDDDKVNLIRGLARHNRLLADRWDFVAIDSELFPHTVSKQRRPTAGSRTPGAAIANLPQREAKRSFQANLVSQPRVVRRPARPKN